MLVHLYNILSTGVQIWHFTSPTHRNPLYSATNGFGEFVPVVTFNPYDTVGNQSVALEEVLNLQDETMNAKENIASEVTTATTSFINETEYAETVTKM